MLHSETWVRVEFVYVYLVCSAQQIYFKKKKTGGISFNTTAPLTHIDEKLCYQILHEYKIHNAEVRGSCFILVLSKCYE